MQMQTEIIQSIYASNKKIKINYWCLQPSSANELRFNLDTGLCCKTKTLDPSRLCSTARIYVSKEIRILGPQRRVLVPWLRSSKKGKFFFFF